MEMSCVDQVIEEVLRSMDEDPDVLLPINSDSFFAIEEWYNKNAGTPAVKGILKSELDPLLSEAQLIGPDPLLNSVNIRIPCTDDTLKQLHSAEPQLDILRPVDNTTDENENSLQNVTYEGTKTRTLKTKEAHMMGVTVDGKTASIVLTNLQGIPVLPTQFMQLPENSNIRLEQMQKVICVNHIQVHKAYTFTLPEIVTTLSPKIYLCPLRCNFAFFHFAEAKLHTLQHMQVKPYKCDTQGCPWEFYTPAKLARHAQTHSKNRNFICDILDCKKRFSTIYNLNQHKKKHNKPRTLPCPVASCDMKFQNDVQRRVHCKTHDVADAPFRCHIGNCRKSFFTKGPLIAHVRNCSQKDLICNYPGCGKVCSSSYRLREHIRTHTGVKPYKCNFENCTWSFSTASKLKRHQCIHTGDRKFHCTMGSCNKSFLRSEHLREHTLTHIEKKSVDTEGATSSKTIFGGYARRGIAEKKPETKVRPDEEESVIIISGSDFLLEEAIKSLTGTSKDIILGGVLACEESEESMEDKNFSTVNLRDLD